MFERDEQTDKLIEATKRYIRRAVQDDLAIKRNFW